PEVHGRGFQIHRSPPAGAPASSVGAEPVPALLNTGATAAPSSAEAAVGVVSSRWLNKLAGGD
ncbi:hypothetical protein, partial [Nocardia farcinica]|uniref:hypothetical protein n=1 Tax=Nocardia farcinica TaxID=37329 RepID=UPI0034DAC095